MLPISEVIFAYRHVNSFDDNIDWILYDVYKIASQFPLEMLMYGNIFNKFALNDRDQRCSADCTQNCIVIEKKFLNKSIRDDLKGLKLKCGLVVCIFFFSTK